MGKSSLAEITRIYSRLHKCVTNPKYIYCAYRHCPQFPLGYPAPLSNLVNLALGGTLRVMLAISALEMSHQTVGVAGHTEEDGIFGVLGT
jgi:hypothetical protein